MNSQSKRLFRSVDNRMVAGVCAGMADFFGIDPTVVRLLFVFGVIFGYGILLLVYLILFIVVPEEPRTAQPVVSAPPDDEVIDSQPPAAEPGN